MPSVRFGTVHLYNNLYHDCRDGIHARMHAYALAEANVFDNVVQPFRADDYSPQGGTIVVRGYGSQTIHPGSAMPYDYRLDPPDQVARIVTANAGPHQIDRREEASRS